MNIFKMEIRRWFLSEKCCRQDHPSSWNQRHEHLPIAPYMALDPGSDASCVYMGTGLNMGGSVGTGVAPQ